MSRRFCYAAILVAALGVIASSMSAQTLQRRATLAGGGNPGRGNCTVEVVVDGAADVEIRGDTATLRNLSGQPPQWRRFECTGALPANPANFRFTGVDGRGRQELVRDPSNGGVAVVRIQDPDGGAEGYTFDISWGESGYNRGGGYPDRGDRGRFDPPNRRPGGGRYTTEEAVRVCQDAVRQQAAERFRTRNIAFRRTTLDDNPGRRDWVMGILDIRRGYDRDEAYRFSCSVNFDTGEVRSVQIDPIQGRWPAPGDRDSGGASNLQAIDSCERAVDERIRRDGYQHVDVVSINVDDRPGRNDWIVGNARADRQYRSDSFEFSCSVNLQNGVVRSVDVRRR